MADEWNFAQTTWDGSTDNGQDLMDKIESFLTQSGWEAITTYADYGPDRRYFLYGDRATRDTWHYTGDGTVQHCGIRLEDQQYNGGANDGTKSINILAYLENSAGDDLQIWTHYPYATILIDTSVEAAHDIMMIGGEYGLHYEMGTVGNRASVAHGMIGTHLPWSGLNGTRDAERMKVTQGICMDLFGAIRFASNINRAARAVLDNGVTNRNMTAELKPWMARGLSDDMHGGTIVDNVRAYGIGSLDSIFGYLSLISSTYTYGDYGRFHFGLFNTPFDDRWRISPMMFLNPLNKANTARASATSSTSASNNVVAVTSGPAWLDVRNTLREVRKFVVVGYQLTPWQNITDQDSGTVYRVVQADDAGRFFNLGVEWPGAGNEVTIP